MTDTTTPVARRSWEPHNDSCECHIGICADCGCTNEFEVRSTDRDPDRNDFVKAAEARIESAGLMGSGFLRTAIRVELLSMWEAGAASRSTPAEYHTEEFGPSPDTRHLPARSTQAEALECDHPASKLTTSTYNGPDGRMAGVEHRCACGASWREVRGSTPAEALDPHRLGGLIERAIRESRRKNGLIPDGWTLVEMALAYSPETPTEPSLSPHNREADHE